MTDALTKIESVGQGAPIQLQIFEDARREIADAKTVEQVNRIVALATGLAAAARKATDREMEAEAEAEVFGFTTTAKRPSCGGLAANCRTNSNSIPAKLATTPYGDRLFARGADVEDDRAF